MKKSGLDSKFKVDCFVKEVELLSILDHPNIIKLYFVNLNGEYVKKDQSPKSVAYYVMELEKNSDLFDYIDLSKSFSETYARFFFVQLIKGKKLI
jgi:serine/threonine protein kinase